MSMLSSSSSRLLQLLEQRKNEILLNTKGSNDIISTSAVTPIKYSNDDDDIENNNIDENDNETYDIDELMNDIQTLSIDERGIELRDAARYNDFVVLYAVLYVTATTNSDATSTTPTTTVLNDILQLLHSSDDATGNTALHMASANNHSQIVNFILQVEEATIHDINNATVQCNNSDMEENNSTHTTTKTIQWKQHQRLVQRTNKSGNNTPLHYAITNRSLESIQFLMMDYNQNNNNDHNVESATTTSNSTPSSSTATVPKAIVSSNMYIDVLQKNSAGRSCLTEAFALTSSNTDDKDNNTDSIDQRNHAILTLILEHPSANEERLLSNNTTNNTTYANTHDQKNEESNSNNAYLVSLPPCHTHHFRLLGSSYQNDDKEAKVNGIEIMIREMAMAPPSTTTASTISNSKNDDLITILGGTNPIQDTTGYGIWTASIIMAQWMTDIFRNDHHHDQHDQEYPIRTILELGAGCGVPGITIAKSILASSSSSNSTETSMTDMTKIYLTDLNPTTIRNLQYNISLNNVDHIASALSMDWNDVINDTESTKIWPWTKDTTSCDNVDDHVGSSYGIDILIGSDLVYQKEVVPMLIQTIVQLHPHKFYYGAGKNRDGHDIFIKTLCNYMILYKSYTAPSIYRSINPLYNQDDDECFIHFHDLLLIHQKRNDDGTVNTNNNNDNNDDTFTLYEFKWKT